MTMLSRNEHIDTIKTSPEGFILFHEFYVTVSSACWG